VGTTCGDLKFPQTSSLTPQHNYLSLTAKMTKEECCALEEKTRDQTKSSDWVTERKTRLTASNFGSILSRKKVTDKFVMTILDPKPFTSAPTSYGISNEKTAIQQYIEKTGNHAHDCGLIVNHAFPFLGGTPDGKVCEKGNTGLIEVKCPYAVRNSSIEEACNSTTFCLVKKNELMALKEDHHYYYQVQGQLMVSGASFYDFVVYTRKDLFIQRIYPNVLFMEKMIDKLSQFYLQYMKPLMNKDS